MINFLNNMLAQLFQDRVGSNLYIGFQPPDGGWDAIRPKDQNALNIYLVDLRENRKLRSNNRTLTPVNGDFADQPDPRRVDCHYLVSAWSSSKETDQVAATEDEHVLLYQVASAVANVDPLSALKIFASAPLPPHFPPELLAAELPVTLMPVEGFPKLAEFWGSMGRQHPWKPVVYIVVTLPLSVDARPGGPMVTTTITRFQFDDQSGASETLYEIGGTVFHKLPSDDLTPLDGIWVELLDLSGRRLQLVQSNAMGRFTFSNLTAGDYQLRAAAAGLKPKSPTITVPSPTGEYNLVFDESS